MGEAGYQLALPADDRRRLALGWLLFAIAALLVSGLFVILILFSRTPGLQTLFPVQNFFRMALAVHVDFSVLLWFAGFAAMFWTLAAEPRGRRVDQIALVLAIAGALLMAVGPFRPGEAIMSNYVPVVENDFFLAGLSVFAAGIVLAAVRMLYALPPVRSLMTPPGVLRFGVATAALSIVLAGVALLWSLVALRALPDALASAAFFEILFWNAGHVQQFAWTQLMLVAWLWLAAASGIRIPLSPRLIFILLLAGAAPVLLSLWPYLMFDVGSPQQRTFFIWLMSAAGGVAAGPIGLALIVGWWQSPAAADRTTRGLRATVLFSIALFGLGGLLGFMIEASNTIIPAHYHGSITAVTLAFMGLALYLLPVFGFGQPGPKLVQAVPWVYGIGQVVHVAGLAFAGGQGVQRKTAGADQGLESVAQIASMAMTGLGGFIAVVAGVLFLVAALGALRRRSGA